MKNWLLLSVSFFLFMQAQARMIQYKVDVSMAHTRYAMVEMEVSGHKQSQLEVVMPVWIPGSYMVREFSKNVEGFFAFDQQGNELKTRKTTKNTWLVECGKNDPVTISYKVYGNEVSVRNTYLDEQGAFLNPSSLLMFITGMEQVSGYVTVVTPDSWKQVVSGLKSAPHSQNRFSFKNYDELADCPIQAGNFDVLEFRVKGVPHYVALVGHSNVDKEKLEYDLHKLCNTTAEVIGKLDFDHYWFFVHHVDQGGGGLEHRNSTAVVMPRYNYSNANQYEGFLRLCAHEYFHTWNVKRIRPIELGPFDYSNEVYTQQLWVAEGITTYYDKLLMYRAGFWDKKQLLNHVAASISYSENMPGAKVQSLAMASMDAWIKFYRPDENSINSAISYYTKGAMAAAMLDLTLHNQTQGAKNLDDLLGNLYADFYEKKGRGFTEKEFIRAAQDIAGIPLQSFFDTLIYSTLSPNYNSFLNPAGYELVTTEKWDTYLGANVEYVQGETVVKSVIKDSPAFNAGLSKGDVILAINKQVPIQDFKGFLQIFLAGAEVEISVKRGKQLLSYTVVLNSDPALGFSIQELETDTSNNIPSWPR